MRAIVAGAAFGGLTAAVSVTAVGRAWASCDVGVNAAANTGALLFLIPVIWLAAAVPLTVLHGALGRTRPRTAFTAGLLFTLWFTWFLVTWLGMPDTYPDPVCPGNVPPWWPGFLPA
ncbi:hypothetical protein [Streptomyces sp. NPDC002491]